MKAINRMLMAFAIMSSFSPQVFALAPWCPEARTVIFFINGVDNDIVDARFNADDILKKGFQRFFSKDDKDKDILQCLTLHVSYNTNEWFILDLVQAVSQRIEDYSSTFWRWWADMKSAPDWFQQATADSMRSVNNSTYVIDADLQEMVNRYVFEIQNAKNKVVIVAHSQGNLYANEAYRYIHSNIDPKITESLRIVSVATPDTTVEGWGQNYKQYYTTLYEDPIWLIAGALSWNVTNGDQPLSCNDGLAPCHSFEHYINGSVSGDQIMNQISNAISSLVNYKDWFSKIFFLSSPIDITNPDSQDALGIPGDNKIKTIGLQYTRFAVQPTFPLPEIKNGITLTAFPLSDFPITNLSYIDFTALVPLPCNGGHINWGGDTVTSRPTVNGVQGAAVSFSQEKFNFWHAIWAGEPGCNNLTSDQLQVDSVELFTQFENPYQENYQKLYEEDDVYCDKEWINICSEWHWLRVLDAFAIGIGENVFPPQVVKSPWAGSLAKP